MLTQIHIRNLATIHELNLDCLAGTTVMTGETGAGKSILIDAIELALGNRATSDVIRADQDKTDISLCFDIKNSPEIRAWLQQVDLTTENNECIIRRTITRDGRSRSYINNLPITLQPLRELSELLISIHGQHEHQTLLKSSTQRDMLDRYAGHVKLVQAVSTLAEQHKNITQKILELQTQTHERATRSEFLKFQLQELENLNLYQNEFETLDLEHRQLANAGELLQHINHALNFLAEHEEHNATHSLNQALQSLETIQRVDPKISNWIESIKTTLIQISDIEDELQRYLGTVELDPEKLQLAEQRIALLFDMARKHKISPQELFAHQQKLAAEYSELENSDDHLQTLQTNLKIIATDYHLAATALSQSRKKHAVKLTKEITQTIQQLSLPHAEFHIAFEPNELNFSATGSEKIIFQITTNKGQPLQALAKIASGGELSRISLAIYIATAEQHTIPTLIFDEVDVGISGGTAEIVGTLLRKLGETHQVLCVTHLPQVAAKGHHHFCVKKSTEENTTETRIVTLSSEEKIKELARLLGGVKMTQTTLDHAREMLEPLS